MKWPAMTSELSITERLARDSFTLDHGHPHITLDQSAAQVDGLGRLLIRICPAHVYSENPDGTIAVQYAACLECGTCRAAAPAGALAWQYPRGGYGITYRFG